MATDKSEPHVGLIIKVGIISVLTVLAVRFALGTYFDQAAQAEELRKIGQAKPEALMELRTDEHARLMTGSVPIEQAMQDLAKKGRMSASPDIVPTASRDVAPLQGWMKMPSTVPAPMLAPSASPALAADAGASGAETDAGITAKPADAGAGKKKP